MTGQRFQVRPIEPGDSNWIVNLLSEHWASPKIVSQGSRH
jgi:hypothetical protein